MAGERAQGFFSCTIEMRADCLPSTALCLLNSAANIMAWQSKAVHSRQQAKLIRELKRSVRILQRQDLCATLLHCMNKLAGRLTPGVARGLQQAACELHSSGKALPNMQAVQHSRVRVICDGSVRTMGQVRESYSCDKTFPVAMRMVQHPL